MSNLSAYDYGADQYGLAVNESSSEDELVESSEDDVYDSVRRSLVQFIVPILVVIGTFGNILTIMVLHRRLRSAQANSTNFYLIVLSIADLCSIYVGLPNCFLTNVYDINLRMKFDIFCRLQTFLVYFASHFVVWTLSAVTIDRTIWTAAPYRAKEICTVKSAKVVTCVLVLALVLVDNHFLWTLHVTDLRDRYNFTETLLDCTEYDIFVNFATVGVAWIDLCLLSIFPFTILITSNCIIIVKLRQYAKMRNSLLRARKTDHDQDADGSSETRPKSKSSNRSHGATCAAVSSTKEHSLTMMLLTTSVFFIATMLPITVCNFYYVVFDAALKLDAASAKAMSLFQTMATLLSYLNISVHFVLFCLSGKTFRNEVSAYLREMLSRMFPTSVETKNSAVQHGRSRRACNGSGTISHSHAARGHTVETDISMVDQSLINKKEKHSDSPSFRSKPSKNSNHQPICDC